MRFENPHSLSYQEKTLAMLPTTTLVSGASTIEEAGLPRKSMETSSSFVTSRIHFMVPAAAFLSAPLISSAAAAIDSRHVRSTMGTDADGTRQAAPSGAACSSG